MTRSAADLVFRFPDQRDIADLAENMRAADVRELAACNHLDLGKIVAQCVSTSTLCWSILEDDELLCIFGVAPLPLPKTGAPWLLGTRAMLSKPDHPRKLITGPAPYIAAMRAAYPHLLNFVHHENSTSIRWLKRLGFTVLPAAPFGPNGVPFHRFELNDV